jgi:hypothetical protein
VIFRLPKRRGKHLREETYRHPLAVLVTAQQHEFSAFFGAADVSSWEG